MSTDGLSPSKKTPSSAPQVKICGLTRVEEALICVEAGAAAIGCVFYPPSPRHVSDEVAREIRSGMPPGVCTVGVFVNEGFSTIMAKVNRCGLSAVQLHGRETPDMVNDLLAEGVKVVKALFVNGHPDLSAAGSYSPTAFLVECAGGALPGGNALRWDWSVAANLSNRHPVIVAGGLTPENVGDAIPAACPDALDVSSGVESSPGRKDPHKVRRFLDAVSRARCDRRPRKVF